MDRHEELCNFIKENYTESEEVQCIVGDFVARGSEYFHPQPYRIGMVVDNSKQYSEYNEQKDELYMWGRGMGRVYQRGVWATKADGTTPTMEGKVKNSYNLF